jgi:hypothetical protein
VEQDVDVSGTGFAAGFKQTSVHLDTILIRIDFQAHPQDQAVIDLYPTLGNEFVCLPPGTQARGGNGLV